MNVRVRGIYATALTELFRRDHAVVQASPPIRERFDDDFAGGPADATVHTTDDRLGVGLAGRPRAVDVLRDRLSSLARDTLSWEAPAPRGAVFGGVVTETLGSGAIVDLGPADPGRGDASDPGSVEGFLPYDRVEGYVEEGDEYRVQVASPEPPWSDARPSLATDLRIPGGLVELRRDGVGGSSSETARMADLLPVDPPEGWTPRWSRAADDASLDAMADALERATDRAESVMEAVASAAGEEATDDDGKETADDDGKAADTDGAEAPDTDGDTGETPRRIVTPQAGGWVWFGRESRFALDEVRRGATTTMPGHHRIKAGAESASAAVDLVEAVCDPTGEFPFGAVTRQFGPGEGDRLAIAHGKPDGRTIVLGRGEVTERDPDGSVTVEREMSGGGTYDALGIDREAGDVATTTFVEGRWWYATVYRGDDDGHRGTYVNVCTPVEIFPDAARYVDLHVDVVKFPDGEVRRVDDDELDAAVEAGRVPGPLAERARDVATSIENAL